MSPQLAAAAPNTDAQPAAPAPNTNPQPAPLLRDEREQELTQPRVSKLTELDALTDYGTAMKARIQDVIDNFVRYHIQDNSIFLGGADSVAVYETAAVDTTMNRFRRLSVSNVRRVFRVTDASGQTANVIDGHDSNVMTRQYYFTKSNRTIYGTSSAVVHLIDRALSYGDFQFLPADFPDPPAFPDWMTEDESSSTTNPIRRR